MIKIYHVITPNKHNGGAHHAINKIMFMIAIQWMARFYLDKCSLGYLHHFIAIVQQSTKTVLNLNYFNNVVETTLMNIIQTLKKNRLSISLLSLSALSVMSAHAAPEVSPLSVMTTASTTAPFASPLLGETQADTSHQTTQLSNVFFPPAPVLEGFEGILQKSLNIMNYSKPSTPPLSPSPFDSPSPSPSLEQEGNDEDIDGYAEGERKSNLKNHLHNKYHLDEAALKRTTGSYSSGDSKVEREYPVIVMKERMATLEKQMELNRNNKSSTENPSVIPVAAPKTDTPVPQLESNASSRALITSQEPSAVVEDSLVNIESTVSTVDKKQGTTTRNGQPIPPPPPPPPAMPFAGTTTVDITAAKHQPDNDTNAVVVDNVVSQVNATDVDRTVSQANPGDVDSTVSQANPGDVDRTVSQANPGDVDSTVSQANAAAVDNERVDDSKDLLTNEKSQNPMATSENRSILRPEAASYIANLTAANNLFSMSLNDHLRETPYIDRLTGVKKDTSLWLRQVGSHNNWRDGSGQLKTQSNSYVTQLGGDIVRWNTNGLNQGRFGLMVGYGKSSSHTLSSTTNDHAKGSINGYSLGAYSAWFSNYNNKSGLYVGSWLQYNWFNNSVQRQGVSNKSYNSKGITASVETSYAIKMGDFVNSKGTIDHWFIQPQAQVTWMGVKANDQRLADGSRISNSGNSNIQTRLGLRTYLKGHHVKDKGKGREFEPFIEANWIHNTRNFGATMDGDRITQAGTRNIGEVKVGVAAKVNSKVNLWGNIGSQVGNKGYNNHTVMLGVKYHF